MSGMSVGGLISGLDTNSIIAQLTALEQAKVRRELQKKENAENTLSKFKDLQIRLGNLSQKASVLETLDKFNVFRASSNYDEYATISGKEGATAGRYELVVKQLATTQKVASNKISTVNEPLVKDSDLEKIFGAKVQGETRTATITLSKSEAGIKADPLNKTVDVVISETDTLKDVVNKINAAEGAGVRASIMTMADGDNRLVLTAVDTGTKSFYIKDSGADGTEGIMEYLGILSSGSDSSQVAASSNALVTSNGVAATTENTFEDLNSAFNKIKKGDVVGIYLPTSNGAGNEGGWVTFSLYDENGESRKIGDVLNEINTALGASGSNVTAKLNDSGEIVLTGNLNGDQNFDNASLKDVKIQIGTLSSSVTPSATDPVTGMALYSEENIFSDVKKDMGSFSARNVFENTITEAQNAFYTIDGMAVSSQSNSDDKTISGTVFTLKKVSQEGMEPIKLSLDLDKEAIVSNINAFVEEFNALMKFIDENAKAIVKEETDPITGKKTSKREVGAFTGDSNISSLRENLRQMMTGIINELTPTTDNGYTTAYSSVSRLGITTQKDGSISVDRDKLTKALDADFEGVRRLFTANWFSDTPGFSVGRFTKDSKTGTYEVDGVLGFINGQAAQSITGNIFTLDGLSIETPGSGKAKITFVRGIASQITNFMEKARSTVDGYFKESEKTYQDRIDSIQKRVDELQMRVDNYSARITRQFAALERSMGNLQSQTANMMAAMSAMTYNRR
ncbi:MAG: flagellar filament capping protein FliD [Fibromonadaceae bacterium]|jgi:flagellar hook-associated protein 2|nr:flagellar filament capping protein FliD [Fibromonadaceae bacterium]